MEPIINEVPEKLVTVLNRRASAHSLHTFNDREKMLELCNILIRIWHGKEEDPVFQPGSKSHSLYTEIDSIWLRR
jgi:hypothetical protein